MTSITIAAMLHALSSTPIATTTTVLATWRTARQQPQGATAMAITTTRTPTATTTIMRVMGMEDMTTEMAMTATITTLTHS